MSASTTRTEAAKAGTPASKPPKLERHQTSLPNGRTRHRSRLGSNLLTTLTWILGVGFFAPVAWLILTSFKAESDAASNTPVFFFSPTLEQYQAVLNAGSGTYFANSIIATIASTALVILLAVPAAYALSIRPVKKTQDVLFFFISTKMLPVVAVIMPIYVLAGQLRVLDSVLLLIVLYTSMNLPIAIWMMRSFFQEVPGEVLEAAAMDGAGLIKTMRTILIPMVTPGLAATALICVIFSWNEFFFALNLTSAQAATVPMFLVSTMASEGLYLAKLSAASVLASLPVVIAGWAAQKQLVRGLSMGAVK